MIVRTGQTLPADSGPPPTAPTARAWECDRAFRRGEEHQGGRLVTPHESRAGVEPAQEPVGALGVGGPAREEHRNGNWRQRRSCDGAGRKPDAAWRPTGPIARVAADAETSHLMRQRLQPGRIRPGPAFTLASVLVVGSGSGRDYRTTYSRILPRTCGRGSPTRMLRVGRRLAISASFRGAVTGAST